MCQSEGVIPISNRWELSGLAEATCDTDWRINLEQVIDIRLGFILEGHACWHMNDANYNVGPGDIVVVLPGTYRSAYSSAPFRHVSARLRWVRSENHYHLVSVQELPEWLVLPGRIHVGLPKMNELLSILRQANAEAELGRPGSREMVDALLRQFLIILYRTADEQRAQECRIPQFGPDGVDVHSTTLNHALEYIHLHLDRPIYISQVARACGYSEPHLRRLFRKHVAMTPTEYITKARIERAQRLLHTNQFTVSQVSAAVGFTDPFHFSRKFKSVVCVPPRAFSANGVHSK